MTEAELKSRIKSATLLKDILLVLSYRDDGIACAEFTVDGKRVKWLWCGDEAVSALTYVRESPSAQHKLADLAYAHIIYMEGVYGDEDDDEDELAFLRAFDVNLEEYLELRQLV